MMDRLTTETNITDALNDEGFALMCFLKLKQYEDTGLTPDEVLRVKRRDELRLKLMFKSMGFEVITDG